MYLPLNTSISSFRIGRSLQDINPTYAIIIKANGLAAGKGVGRKRCFQERFGNTICKRTNFRWIWRFCKTGVLIENFLLVRKQAYFIS